MRNCNINKKETSGATTVNTYIGDYTAGLIMDYADEHDIYIEWEDDESWIDYAKKILAECGGHIIDEIRAQRKIEIGPKNYYYNLNPDWERRDEILFGYACNYQKGGLQYFDNLDADKLQILVDEGFIDIDTAWNNAPPQETFLEFIKEHPTFVAYGYAVSPERMDYRFDIEGVRKKDSCGKPTKMEIKDLRDYFSGADMFDEEFGCVWYD